MLRGLAGGVVAEGGGGVADCVAIENDLDRLACYDRATGREPETAVVADLGGNWSIRTDTSEFKDTSDVYMSVESEEPLSCGMFNTEQKARLILRCKENTTSLIIVTACHLASGFHGYGRVEYRIDDEKARSRNFDESTDNKALGLWNGGSSIPFIKQMFGHERALFRFTPFNESPVTARFDISGVETAIAPLREACHW